MTDLLAYIASGLEYTSILIFIYLFSVRVDISTRLLHAAYYGVYLLPLYHRTQLNKLTRYIPFACTQFVQINR